MPTLKQRILTTFIVTVCAGILGVALGLWLARVVTIRMMQARLDNYAGRLVADEEAADLELRTALAAIDASEHKNCAAPEIAYLRALIFESQSLKDAGRMRAGAIACSAALGKPAQTSSLGDPEFTQQDGTAIYRNLVPYQSTGLSTITLERGDSFVVYTPMTRLHVEPEPLRFVETAMDAPTQRRGRLLGDGAAIPAQILGNEGLAQQDGTLYATRCSIRFFDCVTSFVAIPDAIAMNRAQYRETVLLCGLAGAVLGCVLALLYRRNKSLEQQLRRAVRKGRVRAAYQPIVDLHSGRVVGAEALARWEDEDGHAVGPDIFIPLAEKGGFIGELTRQMIRRVLRDFAPVLRGDEGFRVSVNVTADDLEDPQFPVWLEDVLRKEDVSAGGLTLEITEGSTVQRGMAIEAIRRLRAQGHKVHIDDFGTGYSSLSYLHDLAVDAIKIDQSFTRAIGTGSVTVGILPQILSIVEALHLNVIAEGVETQEQASYFADANLPVLGQGWLFGRPQPFVEFEKLRAERAWCAEAKVQTEEDASLLVGSGVE
jgi:sensor c-di-GMP phosphodiesterase-like protein